MTKRAKKQADCDSPVTSIPAPRPSVGASAGDLKGKWYEEEGEGYRLYCDSLVSLQHEQGREFDKWLLTLSGVALGFSISVVKDFIRPAGATIQHPVFLYASWIGLGIPL